MSLTELIAGVEDHQRTLTVFNAGEDVTEEIRSQFDDRNVAVERERTESGRPGEFVTLSDREEVLAATSLSAFRNATGSGPDQIALDDRGTSPILDRLDETMFTTWSSQQMLTASREIEDRAFRVGIGKLHAGFQRLSVLNQELDRYDRLGESSLDVHAYAIPDADPPEERTFTLHIERAEEIARSWFVAFDGGGDDRQKCALLAEERDPDDFYGFWTYDPGTVDYIIDHLESSYGLVEQ